jgi:hypothetical protein
MCVRRNRLKATSGPPSSESRGADRGREVGPTSRARSSQVSSLAVIFHPEVDKVTFKSDETLSNESLFKSNTNEVLSDDFTYKVMTVKHLTVNKRF